MPNQMRVMNNIVHANKTIQQRVCINSGEFYVVQNKK
jgi:hypothetical protein